MRRALAAGLLAATLAACSSAGNGPQLAMTDALMRGASAGRAMALALSPGEIGSGEPLTVEVSHDHAGYLYGSTDQIDFPSSNRTQGIDLKSGRDGASE